MSSTDGNTHYTTKRGDSLTYRGKFRYLGKDAKLTVNPNLYHLPPLSDFSDVRTLPITDIRTSLTIGDDSPYTLDCHGFTARYLPSKLHTEPYTKQSWNDATLVQTIYMPEVEELVKQITGCKMTVVESVVLRNNVHTEVDSLSKDVTGADLEADDAGPCPRMIGFSREGGASPAPKVHLDFSPIGARTHIRKYHRNLALAAEPVIEAENKLLNSGVEWNDLKDHYRDTTTGEEGIPRFALFSVWRPLKTVRRDPLAVASCESFPTSDYVPIDIVQPSGRLIPSYLSQMINFDRPDSNGSESDGSNDSEEQHRHLSGSYLAYGPQDRAGEAHKWHFISNQEPEDVLIIQLFDNRMEALGPSRPSGAESVHVDQETMKYPVSGVMHSAFELEGQDYDGEARESLEVRVVAFW